MSVDDFPVGCFLSLGKKKSADKEIRKSNDLT